MLLPKRETILRRKSIDDNVRHVLVDLVGAAEVVIEEVIINILELP